MSAERSALAPTCVGFSPDGNLLSALSPSGELSVWQVGDHGAPTSRYGEKFEDGEQLRFVDDSSIAVETTRHVYIVHLPPPGRSGPERARYAVANIGHTEADTRQHLVATTDDTGALVILDGESDRTLLTHPACRGTINRIALASTPPLAAYGCQDGEAGMLDIAHDKLSVLAHLDGGVTRVAASADGRYLMFGGTSGKVVFYDVATRMLHTRLGHATRITLLAPPSPAYPYLVTGDASGALRVWPLPDTTVRLVATTASRMVQAAPLANQGPVIAAGYDTTIPWVARDGRSGELPGHGTLHDLIALSPTRARFAIAFSTSGRMQIAEIDRGPSGSPRLDTGPARIALPAHCATFSPDNAWLAATGDHGDLWFHRASDDRWVYITTGIAQLLQGLFSGDGSQFVAADPSGRALVIDMHAAAFR